MICDHPSPSIRVPTGTLTVPWTRYIPAGKKMIEPTFPERTELIAAVWSPCPLLETPLLSTLTKLLTSKVSYCGLDLSKMYPLESRRIAGFEGAGLTLLWTDDPGSFKVVYLIPIAQLLMVSPLVAAYGQLVSRFKT